MPNLTDLEVALIQRASAFRDRINSGLFNVSMVNPKFIPVGAKISRALGEGSTEPLIPEDHLPLKQYLNHHADLVPKQTDRPTSLSDTGGDWRHVPNGDNDIHEVFLAAPRGSYDQNLDGQPGEEVRERYPSPNAIAQFVNHGKPNDILPLEQAYFWDGLPNTRSLANFTPSLGRDQKGPYLSVYDKWDFDSPEIGPLVKSLMERVGSPFNAYDRYSILDGPNKNGGYDVQRRWTDHTQDIELPPEHLDARPTSK